MPEPSTPLEEFPTPRDRAFGSIVVEMGLASREVVDEALGLQVRYAFSGKDVPSLPQLLVGRQVITSGQADRALAKLTQVASEEGPELAPDTNFSDTSKHLPALDGVGSLEDGPRIIIPATALKEPRPEPQVLPPASPEPVPEEPAQGQDDGRDEGQEPEPEPEREREPGEDLPSVPRIEHAAEEPADTGTVEIIMPVAASDTTLHKPAVAAAVAARDTRKPPHPVPAHKPTAAEPITGYKLLARLSIDETGTIFKARQVAMDRLVALKVLPPRMTADRSFVDTFLREARDAGQLNHPNLVRVHEVGRTGNYYFYSMELIQGQSLEQNIKMGGRMPPARALQLTMEVVKAVEHMAGKNIIHGEISPEAVIVTNEGGVKVLLAGLGRARSDNTRFLVGERYHYVAPERALTDTFDVRADLYSAGAVLHYALTGQHPYTGANANQVLSQHFSAPVPNPKLILTDLAADVARVVTKAMAKNRTERFGTPAEMIAAVDKALAAVKPRTVRGTGVGTRHTTTGAAGIRLQRRRRMRRR